MKIYKSLALALCAFCLIGCGGGATKQAAGPSDVFKKYIEAYDRKDLATMKQTYSKDTVKMYETIAQKRQTSVDEVIKGQFEAETGNPASSKVKIVGEKIEGDAGTVEVKSEGISETEKVPLVKEDGEWKLALDKYVEIIQKRMNEDMNKVPSVTPNLPSNGNSENEKNQNKQ